MASTTETTNDTKDMTTLQETAEESALDKGTGQDIRAKHGDDGLKLIGDERIELTDADNRRLLRKTDRYLLILMSWVYILQIMDKSVFGNGKIFGMTKDLHLVGNQYSTAASIHPIAQLVWQPFSSYILVRFPMRHLLCVILLGWGAAQCGIAGCQGYGGLLACRFLLGLFEAGCLPAFSLLTSQFYRRSEQPLRVAIWYSCSGWATVLGGLISYGLGHVESPPAKIAGWRLIFLLTGLLTVGTVPLVWFIVDGDVASARFFNEEEKRQCLERLRANQTGTGSHEFKWSHVTELFIDPKTYLFLMLTIVCNIGAGVSQYVGPSIIKNLGFDVYVTTLLTLPFGALQVLFIYAGCYAGQVSRFKSVIIGSFTLGTIAGCIMLYTSATGAHFHQNVSLGGYYMLSWNWGCMPLIIAWVVANTGGQTKKSLAMAVFQVGGGVGNIIGPQIFKDTDQPYYIHGLRICLGLFSAMALCSAIQAGVLYMLNRRNEKRRIANGKPQNIKDTSMTNRYQTYGDEDVAHLGQNAFLDLSDLRNDEFTYVY